MNKNDLSNLIKTFNTYKLVFLGLVVLTGVCFCIEFINVFAA